jgi:hypothetical protein
LLLNIPDLACDFGFTATVSIPYRHIEAGGDELTVVIRVGVVAPEATEEPP